MGGIISVRPLPAREHPEEVVVATHRSPELTTSPFTVQTKQRWRRAGALDERDRFMSALVGAICACLRCDAIRASQRVEEAEVAEIYRRQDEEHERKEREKAEKEAARRAALAYVIQVIYFGTPVSTRLQKYPDDSAKAGQSGSSCNRVTSGRPRPTC